VGIRGARRRVDLDDIRRLAASCVGAGARGRADPTQALELRTFEAGAIFTPGARAQFEALLARLGVASSLAPAESAATTIRSPSTPHLGGVPLRRGI
jgi:hypothetical protein